MLRSIKDFRMPLSRTSAGMIVLGLMLACLAATVYSQTGLASINRVDVMVDGLPAGRDIQELVTIQPGDVFSFYEINRILKQLYKTGLFSEIKVDREGGERVDLTFLLTRRLYVRHIVFSGDIEVSGSWLRGQLTALTEGQPFSANKLNRAEEEVKQAMADRGRFDTEVGGVVYKDPQVSFVDITFHLEGSREYRVADIRFTGDVIFSRDELTGVMKTVRNGSFAPQVLESDLVRLRDFYAQRGYQRVQVKVQRRDFDQGAESVVLTIAVEAREKIEIEITGADVPVSLVRPIWEADIFEEWGLEEGKAKIITYLRKKGYLFANVNSSIQRQDNIILVQYDIFPGEKYNIEEIVFEGLRYFSPEELKNKLAIQENIPFLINIDGGRLFELPYEIESLYKTEGFADTRISLNFKLLDNRVTPVFYIEEGPQKVIETVSFSGNQFFTQDRLQKEIESHPGGGYYQPRLQNDVEKLETFYRDQGFRELRIRFDSQTEGENVFSVRFHIQEGRRVKIENIIITGNEVTRRNTVMREVMLSPGDFAYFDRIRMTKRRLENLGVFSEVNIEEIFLSPERINLLVNLREGERNYVSLGIGLETKNEPRSFEIWNNVVRPRGTTEFIRNNIFGTAAQFSLVGQLSIKEKRAVAIWEQPYLFGIPVETFLNAWLEQEERKSYSYDRRGISLSAIRPLSRDGERLLMLTFRYARTSLFDLKIAESGVDRQFFPFSATSVSGSFILDRRNDPFNPESGYFVSTALDWAYPLFNSESDYLKGFAKYQHFFPLVPGLNFSLISRLGLGRGRMPIHERFFAGGSNSFRGTEFDELGPKDSQSLKPVGGKALLLFNFELTFPFISDLQNLYGSVFYDVGNVFSKRSQVALSGFEDALGFGLRYRTPLGPIRLELAWNLNLPPEKKNPLMIITIGNVF
jgi:outer membrane protein insertion porin family